jgi:uncharacterized membrane protein YhaH (DUF805 family)
MNTHDTDSHHPITFVEAVRVCFVKYADFSGCASRPEFWWFALFDLVASVALGVVSDSLSLAFSVATLLPFTAVTTRRLHDANKSGWLQLIGIIPIIGWILIIVWCAQESQPNPYGRSES